MFRALPADVRSMKTPRLAAGPASILLATLLLGACASSPTPRPFRPSSPETEAEPALVQRGMKGDLADAERVEANWKERLAQPYVYVERVGDYRELGRAMQDLLRAASRKHWKPSGPPFALFYDDPGTTSVDALRGRACLPVEADVESRPDEVGFDVLPRAMVVYARVAGAYPELPRVYPELFAYLRRLGWVAGGPIREVYLTDPAQVSDWSELVGEVQIPWTAGR